MTNKCLILGCSHANGAEMHHDPSLNFEKLSPVEQVEYDAQNSYPVLLAEMLGYEPLNYSISGGSNDAMTRIVLEQIDSLTDQDIVIACWTGIDRGELWHEEHQYWRPINYTNPYIHQLYPNKFSKAGINIGPLVDRHQDYHEYAKQWLMFEGNYQRGHKNKIKNVLATNYMLNSRNIRTVNLDSFQGIYSETFAWPADVFRPFDKPEDEFCNFAVNRDYKHGPGGHFFRPAHVAYAEYVYDKIKDILFA